MSEQIETNHIQAGEGELYCRLMRKVLYYLTQIHMDTQCLNNCQYFEGDYQGEGVECKYFDGTNKTIEMEPDAHELMKRMEGLESA